VIENMLSEIDGTDYLTKAYTLQEIMLSQPEELQIDLEPIHYFTEGMYLRSLFIPEGIVVVGEVHRHPHFTILAEGKSTIVSQDGKMDVEAPFVFISTPFAKRSVYSTTDCTWITVHKNPDNETDIDTVENQHVIKDKQELLELIK
jgi:hypothetical protein|tara:strand:- start:227 stop:664 length:438 start_codon:yes stop_codon:yes gene_type:complete